MQNSIDEHKIYIQNKLVDKSSNQELYMLHRYHIDRVRDFQHERLIHLLVTFFFGLLLIISLAAWFWLPLEGYDWLLGLLNLILLILELFYIRHYYQLENGIQSLYPLTKQLGSLTDKTAK